MARLPVFHSQANIETTNPVAPPPANPVWGEMNRMAQAGKELAVQWQKIKNDAETLDGKEKLSRGMSGLLNDADQYNDYKTQADIDKAEKDLLERNNKLVEEVASGFTNEANAQRFRQEYSIMSATNQEKIKGIFRNKTSDLARATTVLSYDRNKEDFVSTGNQAYKDNYLNDLKMASPFYSREEMAKMMLKVDDWDSEYVMNVAASDAKKAQGLVAGLKIGDGKKAQMLHKIGELKNQQLQYARQTALVSLIEDRTEESAKAYIALYPDMSDKKKQSVMDYVRGIEYGTEEGGAGYTSVAEAQQEIKDIAKHFTDSAFDQGVGLDKTFDVAKKTADAVYRSKNLTTEEGKQINDMLSGMMSDKLFAEKVANMPFYYDEHWDLTIGIMKTGQPGYADKMIKHNEKVFAIKGLQKKYNSMMIDAALKGANPEQIQSIYKDGLREIVKTQYRDLVPNIDSFSFKEGDTFVANGKALKFIGFDKDDMIVEVQ